MSKKKHTIAQFTLHRQHALYICACTVQCTHTVQSVHVRRPVNIQSTVHSIPRQSMPIAIIRRYTTVWVRNSGNQGGEKGDT